MKNLLLVVISVFFAAVAVKAAESAPARGLAKAKIVAPITIAHVQDAALDFGALVSPAAPATVTIAADGTVTDSTGLQRVQGVATSADQFTVSGMVNDSTNYQVKLPGEVTLSDGNSHTMLVDGFVASTLDKSIAVNAPLSVGGTLHIGQDQPAGEYQANYNVSITY